MTHADLAGWLQEAFRASQEEAEAKAKFANDIVTHTLKHGPEEVGPVSCSALSTVQLVPAGIDIGTVRLWPYQIA